MSLLSDTQGAPERIYSLARLLAANGGRLSRADVALWLDPQFDNQGIRTAKNTAVAATIGAATSIECVRSGSDAVELLWCEDLDTYEQFCDRVHDRLVRIGEEDPDFLLLDVYAWLVRRLESDEAILDRDPKAIANTSNADRNRPNAGDLSFNSTKFPAWRRWMISLGLGLDLPESPHPRFTAYVAERLHRELARSDLERGVEISAARLVEFVSERMPYLDGGRLYKAPSDKKDVRPLTRVLSRALVDLHNEGVLHLDRRPDARNLVRLQVANHKLEVFETATLLDAPA